MISQAATLLQWLRTAARTLPFQSISEAQETQRQTVQQIGTFFETFGSTAPPIPPEQIFFEDVEQSATIDISPAIIRQLTQELSDCWRQSGPQRLPAFRSALFAFAAAEMAIGESRAFLPFCQKFLSEKSKWENLPPAETKPWKGKIGALLQIFQDENGDYKAVINGLFPGGGKLLARWLHLLPTEVREQMQNWFPNDTLAYPWQDWSNANFQPLLGKKVLAIPDGRMTGHSILLADIQVQQTMDGPRLIGRNTGEPIWMTDLGLEAPATRPPIMQILWQLGVPFVSLEGLWKNRSNNQTINQSGSMVRLRVEYQSLVLQRTTWRISLAIWQPLLTVSGNSVERLLGLRNTLLQNAIPRHFFARFNSEKPRYFDRDIPTNLLLLEKMLRKGSGDLYCTEMLPMPAQAVVEQGGSRRAAEFVVEWEV